MYSNQIPAFLATFCIFLHNFATYQGAAGHKCERCWVYTTDVGDCEVAWLCTACCVLSFGLAEHQEHPSLCMRCADVVLEMGVRLSVSVEGNLKLSKSLISPVLLGEVPSPLETSAVCY